jgi:hypothetical protein
VPAARSSSSDGIAIARIEPTWAIAAAIPVSCGGMIWAPLPQ